MSKKDRTKSLISNLILVLLVFSLFYLMFQVIGYASFGYIYARELSLHEEGNAAWGGKYHTGIDKYWCLDPDSCIHERGHQIDRFYQYSSRSEFQDAVNTLDSCSQDYGGLVDNETWVGSSLRLLYESIHEFPGILENPNRDIDGYKWGGYSELYADLYRLRARIGSDNFTDITPMVVQYAKYCLDEVERLNNG